MNWLPMTGEASWPTLYATTGPIAAPTPPPRHKSLLNKATDHGEKYAIALSAERQRDTISIIDRGNQSTNPILSPHSSPRPPYYRLRTLGKTLAAVATLGTGNSLGPEGPAVELGVASSRWVSAMSNLSVQRQRMLLGAGAAAGVAAGFNAPIAGIFFALEIVKVRTVGACRETSRG